MSKRGHKRMLAHDHIAQLIARSRGVLVNRDGATSFVLCHDE
ncbi:unnamed protein product [uncultured virus]|nr:unnamed protein product [uncultured virus]